MKNFEKDHAEIKGFFHQNPRAVVKYQSEFPNVTFHVCELPIGVHYSSDEGDRTFEVESRQVPVDAWPTTEDVALDIESTVDQIMHQFLETLFSEYPSVKDIILYNIVMHHLKNEEDETMNGRWHTIIRSAIL